MVTIDDNLRMDTLAALTSVVKALELRFPDHNGPFEYCTRLAEETGELIEVVYESKDGVASDEQKQHLIKEQQDVLRVVLGIVGIYKLDGELPTTLETFDDTNDPKSVVEYIVRLGIASGELASAVNHATGMGIKKEKHGEGAERQVLQRAKDVAQVVVWMVRFFNVETELEEQIAGAYRDYREKGFIKG
jgi:NTP pyrophosphatase (non-canonical NTP hydrolase)